jgi:hypothetical protein
MFRHEAAPPCKNLEKCKFKKCQFSHNAYNDNEEHFNESAQNEEVEEETSNIQMTTMDVKNVLFAMKKLTTQSIV